MGINNRFLILIVLIVAIIVGIGAVVYSQARQEVTRFEENRPLPGAVLYDQNGAVIRLFYTLTRNQKLETLVAKCLQGIFLLSFLHI